jgi:hypothetical protein
MQGLVDPVAATGNDQKFFVVHPVEDEGEGCPLPIGREHADLDNGHVEPHPKMSPALPSRRRSSS